MKKFYILLIGLCCGIGLFAQNALTPSEDYSTRTIANDSISPNAFIINNPKNSSIEDKDYQKHKGFYLSLAGGVNYANISSRVVNLYDLTFKGFGGVFDLKIGGAITEDLILHATLTSKSTPGPKIYSNSSGSNKKASNDLSIGEAMIGIGLTYYTPENIFYSGSLGLGNFSVINGDNNTNISSDRGFSIQLKLGKEWWVSKRWGIGVALTYSKSKLTNTPESSIKELLNSNNFGILFNASLN